MLVSTQKGTSHVWIDSVSRGRRESVQKQFSQSIGPKASTEVTSPVPPAEEDNGWRGRERKFIPVGPRDQNLDQKLNMGPNISSVKDKIFPCSLLNLFQKLRPFKYQRDSEKKKLY